MFHARGKHAPAASVLREVLRICEAAPEADPALFAAALNNLAQALRFEGRREEAERLYRDALAIWKRTLGPTHPDVAKGIVNVTGVRHERKWAEARRAVTPAVFR